METFFDKISQFNAVINDFVWIKVGIILLLGTGVLMTILTKFFQISHIGHWLKNTIGSVFVKNGAMQNKEKHSISQFQAMCTALAATIGVGNIAGVASAIAVGGPGAIFWMWLAAFFGMMTSYSENTLGIYYRKYNSDGEWSGGAMYYLQNGLGSKKHCKTIGKILAILFAVFTLFASFGIGNLGQVNKIVINFESAFNIKALSDITVFGSGDGRVSLYAVVIGAVLIILAAIVIIGGIKRIANVAERIVPFMALIYILGTLIIIFSHASVIGEMFSAIFRFAFGVKAAAGGITGIVIAKVMTQGFKRGMFSNEAGLGSAVMVNSSSNVIEPARQGMWGIFEVFFDTIIVCTLTALTILSSGLVDLSTGQLVQGANEATLVADSFSTVFGRFGGMFIAVAILLFAFTTILGWSFYGTKAFEYLFGTKSTIGYKIFFVLLIMGGAIMTSSLAWDISDTFNGMMMIPNLIGVIALSGTVVKITRNYIDRNIKGKKIKPILSDDKHIQLEMENKLYNNK